MSIESFLNGNGWINHFEITSNNFVISENSYNLYSKRGGFLHLRVKSGVHIKLVGFKDSEGESPKIRAYIEEGASLHIMDCIIVSVDCKGLFKSAG